MKQILTLVLLIWLLPHVTVLAQKPRVVISTDIGGTDPDDNQSMVHLLMYSDLFQLEGLISSPSFGNGSKAEILRMIDLYAKDYPTLQRHNAQLMSPEALRPLVKQGRRGLMPYRGYDKPTEGSEWIVRQARQKSSQPLWVLVWGTLEDVAQALHDAPDIAKKIRVYWIGGPNKKWGVNSYAYIVSHFPYLWMIENNATYRGFIGDNDSYYNHAISGRGTMGADFIHYYKGMVKMGDTPSLLYLMHGEPDDPQGESWGGSFAPIRHSSRRIFKRPTTERDTVPVYSVIEWVFTGPKKKDIAADSVCFTATIDRQQWAGYYLGRGQYVLRYSPKAPATLTYAIASPIPELNGLKGSFVVSDVWPGPRGKDDYRLGAHWYSDRPERSLYEGKWQGAKTQRQWRQDILDDWARRWNWLFSVGSVPLGDVNTFREIQLDIPITEGPFKPSCESIEQNYPGTPEWLREAKFGIWVHFGPQAAGESGDWYARNLYKEDHRAYKNHVQRYGHPSEVGYKEVLRDWRPDKLDPERLTRLYQKAGARFLLIQGVHHDNYDLWNSQYQPWNSVNVGPKAGVPYDGHLTMKDGTMEGPFCGKGTGTFYNCNAMPLVMADFYNHTLKKRGEVNTFSIVKFRHPTNGTVNTAEFGWPDSINTSQARRSPSSRWARSN